MLDLKAFQKITYGVYLVSSRCGDISSGCVVNTLTQVTTSPAQVTIAINKQNYTTEITRKSGRFTAVVLSQSAMMELIGRFGFHCSRDTEKFESFRTRVDESGVPFVCEQASARFSCKVVSSMDAGTHIIFLGEVEAAEVLDSTGPMSYAYYHQIKNGVTPPRASVYQPEPAKGYRCRICGYVLDSDTVPDDFVCPICGRGKEHLEKITG